MGEAAARSSSKNRNTALSSSKDRGSLPACNFLDASKKRVETSKCLRMGHIGIVETVDVSWKAETQPYHTV